MVDGLMECSRATRSILGSCERSRLAEMMQLLIATVHGEQNVRRMVRGGSRRRVQHSRDR
eukprot:64464-Prymnesium_polylepis.3